MSTTTLDMFISAVQDTWGGLLPFVAFTVGVSVAFFIARKVLNLIIYNTTK